MQIPKRINSKRMPLGSPVDLALVFSVAFYHITSASFFILILGYLIMTIDYMVFTESSKREEIRASLDKENKEKEEEYREIGELIKKGKGIWIFPFVLMLNFFLILSLSWMKIGIIAMILIFIVSKLLRIPFSFLTSLKTYYYPHEKKYIYSINKYWKLLLQS